MYTKQAELKAGLMFLVALAGLLFVLFRAGGSRLPWAKGPSIHLRFAQGFAAPHVGDPVMMNGLRIGTVKAVGQGTEVRGVPGADGKTLRSRTTTARGCGSTARTASPARCS